MNKYFGLHTSASILRPQYFDLNCSVCTLVVFHTSYFNFIGISTKTLWADVSLCFKRRRGCNLDDVAHTPYINILTNIQNLFF